MLHFASRDWYNPPNTPIHLQCTIALLCQGYILKFRGLW